MVLDCGTIVYDALDGTTPPDMRSIEQLMGVEAA
jgi:hypothetical protein